MADAIAILDEHAMKLYMTFRAKNPFLDPGWRQYPRPEWSALSNHAREEWRDKARAALRSKETLADELRREDRERALLRAPNGEDNG